MILFKDIKIEKKFHHTNCRHNKRKTLYLSENIHPQTLAVVQTRASDLNLDVIIGPIANANLASREIAGILLQYPDTFGDVVDFSDVAKTATKNGVRYFYVFEHELKFSNDFCA